MGWSGSGAVIDAMLDPDAVVSLKGKTVSVGETCLFVKDPAPMRFLRSDPTLVPDGATLAALWTGGRIGLDESPVADEVRRFHEAGGSLSASNRKTFLTLGDARVWKLAEAAAAALAGTDDPAERERRYVLWTRRGLAEMAAMHNRTVVMNNDPGIATVREVHLEAPETLLIGVIRNPGDLYQDRRNGVNRTESALRNLLRALTSAPRRRREYRRITRLATADPGRVWIVAFERFVREPAYRDALLLAAGIRVDAAVPTRFVAERSARNIGLPSRGADRLGRAIFVLVCGRAHGAAARLATPEQWLEPGSA